MEKYVQTLMATARSAFTLVAEASNSTFDPSHVDQDFQEQDVHVVSFLTLASFDGYQCRSDSAHTSIRKSECKI